MLATALAFVAPPRQATLPNMQPTNAALRVNTANLPRPVLSLANADDLPFWRLQTILERLIASMQFHHPQRGTAYV